VLNLIQDPYSEFAHPVEQKTKHGYAKLENITNTGDKWYIFFDDESMADLAEDNDTTIDKLIEEEGWQEANCIIEV